MRGSARNMLIVGAALLFLVINCTSAQAAPAEITVSIRAAYEPFMQEVIRRFNESNSGVTAQYQVQPGVDKLTTQLVAGAGPDIFEASSDDIRRMAEMGAM